MIDRLDLSGYFLPRHSETAHIAAKLSIMMPNPPKKIPMSERYSISVLLQFGQCSLPLAQSRGRRFARVQHTAQAFETALAA